MTLLPRPCLVEGSSNPESVPGTRDGVWTDRVVLDTAILCLFCALFSIPFALFALFACSIAFLFHCYSLLAARYSIVLRGEHDLR